MKQNNCVFCKFVADQALISGQRLLERDDFYLILSLHPQTSGHSLVIPKKHFATLSQIPVKLQGLLFQETIKAAELIQKALKAKAYVIKVNNNLYKLEGQGHVGHIHFHIIPRYKKGEKLLEKSKQASKKTLMKVKNKLASSLEEYNLKI